MTALLALLALSGASAAPVEVGFLDVSLDLRGELLDWRFVDVDQDGASELCLALRTREGERRIDLHRTAADRIDAEPYAQIHVLDDVLAYGFAELREEPGLELLLLTRTGAFSYSPTKSGYRGNARRLLQSELIYDVPDPHSLPHWSYVFPGPGGDRVIVPARAGLELWAPATAEAPAEAKCDYRRAALIASAQRGFVEPDDFQRRARRQRERNSDSLDIKVDIETSFGPFYPGSLPSGGPRPSESLLSEGHSMVAPALFDVNRDGRLDLVRWESPTLSVHLGDGSGFSAQPDRVEELPDYLRREHHRLELRLHDLDGDGDLDLLAKLSEDEDGLDNVEITLFSLANDGQRFFPPQPTQLHRFEAGLVVADVVDADGDGRPDLFLRMFEMPGVIDAVTGLEFKHTHLLYLSERKGGRLFERSPSLKQERTYDENTVVEAAASRDISHDCNGDGVPDMVEVDIQGHIAIRRLKLEKGFFGGRSWELESSPWKRFEVRGDISSLVVDDLNGDGLGDIVSQTPDMLRVLLSSARGRTGGGR